MDGRVTLRDDPQTFELAKKFWEKKRTCAYCGVRFTLLNSFGKWNCRRHYGVKTTRPFPQNVLSNPRYQRAGGQLIFSCCGKKIFSNGGGRTNALADTLVMRTGKSLHPKRTSNLNVAHNLWSGGICRGNIIGSTNEATRIATFEPEGCMPCDHRDQEMVWALPKARDSDGKVFIERNDVGSVVNVQDFAPILALMTDVEERKAFKKIDPEGNISRTQFVQKEDGVYDLDRNAQVVRIP
jgi:hypothetical protein